MLEDMVVVGMGVEVNGMSTVSGYRWESHYLHCLKQDE
jgi:hypothetical protein